VCEKKKKDYEAKKMAVSAWWLVLVVVFCRIQCPVLVLVYPSGVLRDSLVDQHLFVSSYEIFRSPRVVLLNWKRHPFYLKLLLSLSGDVHVNPGPAVSLCGVCGSSVSDEVKAVCCDGCDKWIHVRCDSTISESEYDYMVLNPNNEPWFCASCGSDVSSPPPETLLGNQRYQRIKSSEPLSRSLTCWSFNARSIVNKSLDLFAKLSSLSPDIVMITETYLDSSITNSEIFPSNYNVYRLDRNRHGGGVLIAILDTFHSVACPQFSRPDTELLWIQLFMSNKPVLFGVFYRPPSSPDSCTLELQHSLSLLPSNSSIFLCGDFNLPGIISPVKCSDKSSSLLSSVMDDLSLEQCVSVPTRGSNLLDLVFTNRREMLSSIEVTDNLPNTDHDCIEFVVDILPPKQIPIQRSLYNYKKTDFDQYRRSLEAVPGNWLKLMTLRFGGLSGKTFSLPLFKIPFPQLPGVERR